MNLSIIVAFSFPLFKLKKFKEFVGKSIRWYYITCGTVFGYLPISIFIYTQGYGYGLYNTDDILFIILNYTIGIVTHILLIVLFIHLEYNISNERKNQLKDKYSHNLGNIMQVIYSSSDIVKRIANLEKPEREKLDLLERKCKEASNLINEIRDIWITNKKHQFGGIPIAKIFIVDDDEDIVQLFEQFLQLEGHEIVAKAFNGDEAIEIYKSLKNAPDIILMDHRMPSKDGVEVTEEILSINPNNKIIFVSADYTVRDKALEVGAIDFLEKPIDFNTLFRIIKKHL